MWKLLPSFLNKHFVFLLWHTLEMVSNGFWALSWIRARVVIWSKIKIPTLFSPLGAKCQTVAFIPAKTLQKGVLSLSSHVIQQCINNTLLLMILICPLTFSVVCLKHSNWSNAGKRNCEAIGFTHPACYKTALPSVYWRGTQTCQRRSGTSTAFSPLTLELFSPSLAVKILGVPAWQDGWVVYFLLSAYTN